MKFVSLIFISILSLSAKDFNSWIEDFKKEALREGVSKETIESAFKGVKLQKSVIKADRNQPERKRVSIEDYLRKVVSKNRVLNGVKKYRENRELLTKISKEYLVDADVIVALWGVETLYGKITGNLKIIDSLATLTYDGRREKLFKSQLIYALKILDRGYIEYEDMRGSWAGAMGQCQFMPSSFLTYAIDYNQDGKRDIWRDRGDIFASMANYLKSKGWEFNQPISTKVDIPKNFNRDLANLKVKKTVASWEKLGLRVDKNLDRDLTASLFISNESSYLVYSNFFTLKRWNNSNHFALSVGELAQKIKEKLRD